MHSAPHRRWRALVAAAAGFVMATAASANPVMTVDSLTVLRDGTLTDWLAGRNQLLNDEFDNGNALTGPLFNNSTNVSTYTLVGASAHPELLSETGGQLRLDPSLADPSPGATGTIGLSTRLRLNTNITDPTGGLALSRSFAVAAAFDINAMPAVGQNFGIRLSDGFSNNNDVLELSLTGNHGLAWRRQDFAAGTITNYGFITLAIPTDAAGVLLMLSHATANDPTIQAAWGFTNANGELMNDALNFFATSTTAFHGEVHTRVELRATQLPPVPEPASAALMAAGGLAVAAVVKRRRTTR